MVSHVDSSFLKRHPEITKSRKHQATAETTHYSPLQAACVLAHDRAMADRDSGRLVYSTDAGRICSGCGWPARECRCSQSAGTASIPARIVAKLRMEKKGRGGKTVTVVDGLPHNAAFLKDLSQELKRACGAGGAVQEGAIEIQGDLRERVRDLLTKKGFVVKG
jgi:translation initiation factor 1